MHHALTHSSHGSCHDPIVNTPYKMFSKAAERSVPAGIVLLLKHFRRSADHAEGISAHQGGMIGPARVSHRQAPQQLAGCYLHRAQPREAADAPKDTSGTLSSANELMRCRSAMTVKLTETC